jgi:thymidylate synthase (FAD)
VFRQTAAGTQYFTTPEVALISKPVDAVQTTRVKTFLLQLDQTFGPYSHERRDNLTDSEMITKFAGQLDYLSFGQGHTPNDKASNYFGRIRSEGHGSVLEHVNFGILCWGISRSCTHEIVRHRAGFAYSQVSQRYVTRVRFVERPEFQTSETMHNQFEKRIDLIRSQYEMMLSELVFMIPETKDERPTEYRKRLRQTARAILPNETETSILITANVRAWRHFLEMRANEHAETEIRRLAIEIYLLLCTEAPMLFEDYKVIALDDGSHALQTETRKV